MKTITCPKLVPYVLISLGTELLMCAIGLGLLIDIGWFGAILILFSVVSIVYSSPLYIRCFLPVTVNQDGVHNYFCNLLWSEISSLQIEPLDIKFVHRTVFGIRQSKFSLDLGLMICLQKVPNAERITFFETPKAYFKFIPYYPLKSCVFIPYNEKTVTLIKANAPHLLEPLR